MVFLWHLLKCKSDITIFKYLITFPCLQIKSTLLSLFIWMLLSSPWSTPVIFDYLPPPCYFLSEMPFLLYPFVLYLLIFQGYSRVTCHNSFLRHCTHTHFKMDHSPLTTSTITNHFSYLLTRSSSPRRFQDSFQAVVGSLWWPKLQWLVFNQWLSYNTC